MTANKLPLSVIMLTNRHDERFQQALRSANKAQEVLVIDYPENLLISDFAKERNKAMAKAKFDWVFFLDSDEIITSDSWETIEQLITQNKFVAASVKRQDVFHGKTLRFGETGGVRLIRLFKKTNGQFIRPVHEIVKINGPIKKSNITLTHFAHQSIAQFLAAVTQYAQIEAEFQQDKNLPTLQLGVKTITYPKLKFFTNYFLKLGFLDGFPGLIYAVLMSLHSLFVRVFAYENR